MPSLPWRDFIVTKYYFRNTSEIRNIENESEAGIDLYSQILLVNDLIISPNWFADPLYSSWSS